MTEPMTEEQIAEIRAKRETALSAKHPQPRLALEIVVDDIPALLAEVERLRALVDEEDLRPAYDPAFGDDRECACGHPYYRHFDGYDGNAPVGCKYCPMYEHDESAPCYVWKEPTR